MFSNENQIKIIRNHPFVLEFLEGRPENARKRFS